ncbi:hypothetical protein BS78_01G241000 [Paspalum vaginatum]|nr:hypothetical protein BS78_01G241000 [Paspalum vaginatum]
MGNPSQGAASDNTVSAEELKIFDDLEAEIEDDLEKEIVNEICRLTRHLQRLYQHKDRRELAHPATDYHFSLSNAEDAVLSGINVRLTLDGQCKIDIAKVE